LVKKDNLHNKVSHRFLMTTKLSCFTFPKFLQVVVPKAKGEILGVVIVESGWGSMLPTIVLANLAPGGPAARCGQLNIGDQVPQGPTVFTVKTDKRIKDGNKINGPKIRQKRERKREIEK
jgi:hypothetical protein